MKNRAMLIIAHRLSTIEKTNEIVVMVQGQVIDHGRHDQLLASGGHYAALYRLQFNIPASS